MRITSKSCDSHKEFDVTKIYLAFYSQYLYSRRFNFEREIHIF